MIKVLVIVVGSCERTNCKNSKKATNLIKIRTWAREVTKKLRILAALQRTQVQFPLGL